MTLIKSTKPETLGKRFELTGKGHTTKNVVANISKGKAKALILSTAQELTDVLKSACEASDLALMSGRFYNAKAEQVVNLLTERNLAAHFDPQTGVVPGGVHVIGTKKYAARVKRGIEPSTWVLIDADNPEGIPDEWAALEMQQRLEMLEPIVPGLSTCSRIEYRSSSARVVKDGEKPGGATHAWIQISDATKLDILREHLRVHMQLQDLSFPSPRHDKKTGAVIGSDARTVIDLAVWLPGRLVFCSKPVVAAKGLYVADAGVAIVNPDGGLLNVSGLELPDVTVLEKLRVTTGKKLSYSSNGGNLTAKDYGSLTWDTPIEVKSEVRALREIVANIPLGEKRRCETPFRASQSEAAFIRILDDGLPMLHDVGTGTSYFLSEDPEECLKHGPLKTQLVSADESNALLAQKPSNGSHSLNAVILSEKVPVKTLIKDKKRLVCLKNGPLSNHANAMAVMQHSTEWCNVLAYNELSEDIVLTQPIPGSQAPRSTFKDRPINDTDFIRATAWFNRNGFPSIAKQIVIDAMEAVAFDTVISPIRHYLEDLEKVIQWHPSTHSAKLATMFQDYFGTISDAAIPGSSPDYLAAISTKFMVSAVARALRPGCKVDTMLVLEGPQGIRKSSAARILSGIEYFSDNLPPMGTKDASDHIRGKWIIEVGELSAMQKSEVEAIKAFVSRQEEKFRPAYARKSITYCRRCVFIGTTNQDAYLRDESGNRRFWPAKVEKIDLEALKKDRDFLWAEAVYRFRIGEKWHLTPDEEALARVVQKDRVQVDIWMEPLARKLDDIREISISDAADIVGLEVSRVNRADQNRMVACLKELGFKRNGSFTSGPQRNAARYIRAK